MLPFLLLPPLTRHRFGQSGDAGGQSLQLALDTHQQVCGVVRINTVGANIRIT
jgi:hypothetical protein